MSIKSNIVDYVNYSSVGLIVDFMGPVAPSGWLSCSGGTIGNTGSGATLLLSPSAEDLFKHLWNNFSNTICPVSGGRGASADADWSNNKNITMLDFTNYSIAGMINQGGTLNDIFGGDLAGFANVMGKKYGSNSATLNISDLPLHNHNGGVTSSTTMNHSHSALMVQNPGSSGLTNSIARDMPGANLAEMTDRVDIGHSHVSQGSSHGSGVSHNNIQPVLYTNMIIRYLS